MRATSSTRSISRVRSRRQVGGITSTALRRRPQLRDCPAPSRICRTASGGDVDAQDALELREPQRDRLARLGLLPDVDHARGQLAAGQFQNQLAAAAAGPIDPCGIDAPLEAVRRIAVQVQLAGRVANRQRVELGRFDQQVGRARRKLRCRRRPSRRPRPTARSASAITHMPGSSS